jgi:hypothetical protein
MARKPIWVDGRVDVLLAALHDLGMSVSRAAAAELESFACFLVVLVRRHV